MPAENNDPLITLVHSFVNEANNNKMFKDITNWKMLIKAINNNAELLFPYTKNYPTEDQEYINKSNNDFKGAAFELFGEYFIKAMCNHEAVAIHNYVPNTEKDMGVDGIGTGRDGNPAVVQFKFRSNIKQALFYKELATFGNDSLANYGIITKSEAANRNKRDEEYISDGAITETYAKSKGYPCKDTMKNMIVISTTLEAYYTWSEVNNGSRFLGYNQIEKLTRNNIQFWNNFHKSIEHSRLITKDRLHLPFKKHQNDALTKIKKFIESKETRGQVIIPTGGGKTWIEHAAAEQSISDMQGQSAIVIVVAPRIALAQQLLHEFWDRKTGVWNKQLVCSARHELHEIYTGENYNLVKPTTNTTDIIHAIKESNKNKMPLIFFSTNHSVLKIGKALKKLKTEAVLIIGDEAHNFTAERFREGLNVLKLPTKKWLFFTATRKVSYTSDGYGMNNHDRFGEVIYSIEPIELIKAGMIVPPRLHIINLKPTEDYADLEIYDSIHVRDNVAMIIEGIKGHKVQINKYGDNDVRVIVFCDSAGIAHDFAEMEILKNTFPDFYMEAITSDTKRMTTDRKSIFENFSNSKYSILFHYDIVSEGIDLPGATGILVLRPLGEIKATQGIGRTLRVISDDRKNMVSETELEALSGMPEDEKNKLIKNKVIPGNIANWKKPFGWIILPIIVGKNQVDMERIKSIVYSLRTNNYNIDIEELTIVDNPVSRKKPDPEFDDYDDDTFCFEDMFTKKDITEVCEQIEHDVEKENKAIAFSDITHYNNFTQEEFDSFSK